MGDRGWGRRAAAEEIVMMLPALRCFIPGRMLLIVRNVAVRLPSTDARHASSLMSSSGPGLVKLPPAFATRMSTGPSAPSTARRMRSISASLVTSALTWMTSPAPRPMAARTAESAGFGKAAARVRHEDVHRTERSLDRATHALDLGEPGDIGPDLDDLPGAAPDGGPPGRERRTTPAVQRPPGAMLREQFRDCGTDAARAAGDERHLPGESAHK